MRIIITSIMMITLITSHCSVLYSWVRSWFPVSHNLVTIIMMIVETTASLSTVPAVVTLHQYRSRKTVLSKPRDYSPNDSFNKSYNLVLVHEKVIGEKNFFNYLMLMQFIFVYCWTVQNCNENEIIVFI